MQRFEYQIRSDIHQMAEDAARVHGSREKDRLRAYTEVVQTELNKLGAEGWELVQAPDSSTNRNWIFKRAVG
ncbi:MAG: hypothetical protein RBT39_19505 [Azoarcus sp.]|jgi:hypothetical protein|nr:DUF4177 domain-containing protein [Azoarcus sp.]MDD2875137.1 hypothetical protein [Azoarcus sp.]MDX9839753.1 hypothetical protein [Azoarcus sp.]